MCIPGLNQRNSENVCLRELGILYNAIIEGQTQK